MSYLLTFVGRKNYKVGRCGPLWVKMGGPTVGQMSAITELPRILFKGEFEFALDDKRRLQVPAKWRPPEGVQLSVHFFLPEGLKRPCLLVLSPIAARKLEDKLEAMAFSDPRVDALRRLLGADSEDLNVDSAGRICLPEKLAGKAGLGKKAMLVGQFDRFQIWNPDYRVETGTADEVLRSEAMKLI